MLIGGGGKGQGRGTRKHKYPIIIAIPPIKK